MKVLKIQKLKNNKYKIYLDKEILTTFDNVILDTNLLYKKEIDDQLYKQIINDTKYYDTYNNVVKYILKKRRSKKEVKEYLRKFDIDKESEEKIILRLKNNNLINDIEYVKCFINDSLLLSKNGIKMIEKQLLNQDIPNEIIARELNDIDEDLMDKKLEKLVIKKIRLNKKYSNSYLTQKILNELINLGYEKEKILNVVYNNLNDDKSIIKSEFEKIYIKLSKKYEGYELINNIKNKLISKGFKVEDINNLLKEKTEK